MNGKDGAVLFRRNQAGDLGLVLRSGRQEENQHAERHAGPRLMGPLEQVL